MERDGEIWLPSVWGGYSEAWVWVVATEERLGDRGMIQGGEMRFGGVIRLGQPGVARAVASLGCLLLVLSACRSPFVPVLEQVSPSGEYRAVVGKPPISDWVGDRIGVRLVSLRGTETLFEGDYDQNWRFVAIGWSPDSTKVGVLALNDVGPRLQLGYDLLAKRTCPFRDVQGLVELEIRSAYGGLIGTGEEPLQWVFSQEAAEAFHRRTIARR